METKLEREVRFLKGYAVVTTLFWAVLALSAFASNNRKQRFEEINVERINIVEKDGQVKMVVSNKERFPGPGNVVTGKFEPRSGLKAPGMLFYNEKGDECGGLMYVSKEEPGGKYVSGSLLAFDKYHGDQVLGIKYEEGDGKRMVGLHIWDQPDVSPEMQKSKFAEAHQLNPGPERDNLMQQAVAEQRVFLGRSFDRSATLALSDPNGRPRIRMAVGQDGEPKLEFLDVNGKVIQILPDSSSTKR